MEQTLSIIKPDAVAKNKIGEILAMIEANGLKIIAAKLMRLTKQKAEEFYSVHKGKPFYDSLVNFMISGPIFVSILEGEEAIAKYRKLMGPTDFKKAEKNTIRARFATDIEKNAVHGSDSKESAKNEIFCIFKPDEIL